MNSGTIPDIVAGAPAPQRLSLRLARAVQAGQLLRIRGGDLHVAMAMKVASVHAGGRELPVVHRHSTDDQFANWDFYTRTFCLAVVRADRALPAGTELELTLSGGASPIAGITWTIGAGLTDGPRGLAFDRVSDEAGFRVVAAPARHLEAYLRPDGAVCVEHYDEFGNPAEADCHDIEVVAGDSRVTAAAAPGTGATRVELPAAAGGAARATVRDGAGRSAVTNGRPRAGGMNVYFGDLHWHCNISCDGQRDLADALRSARDELCLDFAASADHMDSDGRYYTPRTTRYQADVARRFDEPGRFCTIPAAELGGRGGHANLYCDGFETFLAVTDRFEAELKPRFAAPLFNFQALSALCPPGRAIIVPHHTNANTGAMLASDGRCLWNAMHFPIPADRKAVRLIEMVQSSGSYETEQADESWRTRRAGFGGAARTALMRGWRLGFVAGTDNHSGWAWRAGRMERVGLTAAPAERLDTRSIFQALHARRCYATSGARIVAEATCNGLPMGSELRLAPGERPEFRIRIAGTAALTAVEIVHMGYTLVSLPVEPGCLDFEARWTDDRPGRPLDDAWYYIRARQEDGHCVWLSPFWIDLAE